MKITTSTIQDAEDRLVAIFGTAISIRLVYWAHNSGDRERRWEVWIEKESKHTTFDNWDMLERWLSGIESPEPDELQLTEEVQK